MQNLAFQEKTSQLLKTALEEEAPLSTGYVDTLRRLITVRPKDERKSGELMHNVMSVLGMKGCVVGLVLLVGKYLT